MIRILTMIVRRTVMAGIFAIIGLLFGRGGARNARTLVRRTRQVSRFTRWR